MTGEAIMKARTDERVAGRTGAEPVRTFSPPADVHETGDAYVLELDMPGAEEKGIEVTTENGILSVRAQADLPAREDATVLRQEIPPRRWFRSFDLGDGIDVARIEGRFSRGVLRLTLPKHETVKPRRIAVAAE